MDVSTQVDALARRYRKGSFHLLPVAVVEGAIAPAEGHTGGAAECQPVIRECHYWNGGEVVVATWVQIGDGATHKYG